MYLKQLFLIISIFFSIFLNATEIKTVKLQLQWKHQFEFAGFYAAKEKGFYKDIGIDLEFIEYQANDDIVSKVLSKEADFGVTYSSLIAEYMNGKALVFLANYLKQSPLILITQKNIKTLSDLKNKKVMGVSNNIDSIILKLMLEKSGVSLSDINIVETSFDTKNFINKNIDAMTVFSTNEIYKLDELGIEYNIFNPSLYGYENYDVNLFTSKEFLENNTDLVKKFKDASNKGWKYALENKDEIINLILKKYNTQKKSKKELKFEAEQIEHLMLTKTYPIGQINHSRVEFLARNFVEAGLVNSNNYSDFKKFIFQSDELFLSDIEKKYILSNRPTFGMLIDYYPFSFKEKGKITGFSYDYINLLIKKSGLKIKIEMDDWSNNLEKFKTKKIDLIDVISYKKERESFTNFSKPYFEIPNVIFARKGEFNNYTGFESLKGKKVGITKGIYYYNDLKSLNLFELVEFEKSKDKMKALALEKVDVIFNNLISGQKYIKREGYSNIKILQELDSKIVKKEDLRIGVNKEKEVLYSIINKSMEAITREEKELLYDKWFTAKVESKHDTNNTYLNNEEKKYLKEKKEITMCIDPDWMPFEKNDNGKHIGMSADYIKILEKSISIPIRMIPTKTWSESLKLGQNKECDIFSLVMPTPQRVKYLSFTDEYLKTPLVIVTNNDELFISNLSELKDKKVGIVKNYAYAEILKTANPNMNFIDVKNVKDGLDKVENDELFAFIGGLATVGYQLQNNYIGQLKIAGKIDEMLELGIGTRKDEPLLKSIFDKSISKITRTEHQNILNKWVSINYQEGINYKTMWQYFASIFVVLIILIMLYRQYLLKDLNKQLNEKVKIELEKNTKHNEILAQQSKMAAMGEMLGNIAHQWRQPLSAISTAATGAKIQNEMNSLSSEQLNSSLDAINNSAQYLSRTIDDFRDFFNPNNDSINMFFIKDVIDKTLKLVKAQFTSRDIEIVKNIENIELLSKENELIQVLINLLNNARDILITKDKQRRLIFITTYKKEDKLYIEILDNADGIKEDIINRVFEPYFTTKHQSQGTGIGLYMSEEIVSKHLRGRIEVENHTYTYEDVQYTGAKFTIKIILN